MSTYGEHERGQRNDIRIDDPSALIGTHPEIGRDLRRASATSVSTSSSDRSRAGSHLRDSKNYCAGRVHIRELGPTELRAPRPSRSAQGLV